MSEGPSTVLKALSLLDFFTERRVRIGLSDMARLAGFNKATTLRLLSALEAKGFVEQDTATRTYHLGPAVLRLAQLREAGFPMLDTVDAVLAELSARTGEMAHASLLVGGVLTNIGMRESRHANRVTIEKGEVLPLHATASGLAVLAFSAPDVIDAALRARLARHTGQTETDAGRLRTEIAAIARAGVALSNGRYEDGVLGIAAPCFSPEGVVSGAVAIAMPSLRATEPQLALCKEAVHDAARQLTERRGGTFPVQREIHA